jgi:aminopeptidase N
MTQTVRLAEYRPFSHRITAVALTFRLHPSTTRVLARIRFEPAAPGADLRLDGVGLRLIRANIDGHPVALTPDATGLTIPAALLPDRPFDWEAEVEIDPQGNTALEGLYLSRGMFCTQCEAEGFRHITFYPDRPDVMAPFRVRIESDLPVLL